MVTCTGPGISSTTPMGGFLISVPFILGLLCVIGWLTIRTAAKRRQLLESVPLKKDLLARNQKFGREAVSDMEGANGTATSAAGLPTAKILPRPHDEGLKA